MNLYRDKLTLAMLREYYIDKKMSAVDIHKLLLTEKNIDVHPNIITWYGNKLKVSDHEKIEWH